MNFEEQQALEVTQMNTETGKEPETNKVCHMSTTKVFKVHFYNLRLATKILMDDHVAK